MDLSYTLKDEYMRNVKLRVQALQEKVSKGKCKDFEDYKGDCGHIKGLEDALIVFNETLRGLMSEEELEE